MKHIKGMILVAGLMAINEGTVFAIATDAGFKPVEAIAAQECKAQTFLSQGASLTYDVTVNELTDAVMLTVRDFDGTAADISDYGLPVDTVNSADEIIDKGIYYVQNVPKEGATVPDWISWVLAGVALIFGAWQYIKRRWLS